MIQALIKFTPDGLVLAMKRRRRLSRSRYVGIAIKSVALSVIVPLVIVIAWVGTNYKLGHAFSNGQMLIGILFATVLCVFMLNAHHVDFWLARRRFRKSPYFNEEVSIEFSDSGYHSRSAKSDSMLQWSVFTKVVHFRDGFLLFQGPYLYSWIPLASLVNPSDAAELATLLRSKIANHTIMEPSILTNDR